MNKKLMKLQNHKIKDLFTLSANVPCRSNPSSTERCLHSVLLCLTCCV